MGSKRGREETPTTRLKRLMAPYEPRLTEKREGVDFHALQGGEPLSRLPSGQVFGLAEQLTGWPCLTPAGDWRRDVLARAASTHFKISVYWAASQASASALAR